MAAAVLEQSFLDHSLALHRQHGELHPNRRSSATRQTLRTHQRLDPPSPKSHGFANSARHVRQVRENSPTSVRSQEPDHADAPSLGGAGPAGHPIQKIQGSSVFVKPRFRGSRCLLSGCVRQRPFFSRCGSRTPKSRNHHEQSSDEHFPREADANALLDGSLP